MTVKDFRDARAIWARLAPLLSQLNILAVTDADAFARYCKHMADWIRLTKVIRAEGETQSVKTVSGDDMIRIHPSLRAREIAERHVVELEAQFGLSPSHRLSIYRDMNALNVATPDLFNRQEPSPATPTPDTADHDDIVGFARGRQPGASTRPN